MSVIPIVTGAQTEVLHKKAQKVKDPNSLEIKQLIEDMFDSMHAAEGMGLAAPQINRSVRVAVIEYEEKRSVYINPTLTSLSKEKVLFEEGCLSLPGQFFWIERSEQVTVRYQNEFGEDVKAKMSGIMAIAIQHEIDHLEGTLIIDRYKKQKINPKTPVWR
ncbi:MAG: peptide deformylase [Candidatus Moranbacteria bacterium]|nr:peptide deformylase [Candidatus Moranbacteria bacterium]